MKTNPLTSKFAVGFAWLVAAGLPAVAQQFQPPVQYLAGRGPVSVTVADIDRDGKPDLAVAGETGTKGYVNMMFGNGDGTFTVGGLSPAGGKINYIAAADFNGDGNLDVAVTQYYGGPQLTGAVDVLFGKGDGTFGSPVTDQAGANPFGIVASDVNLDGAPDLIVADNGFLGPGAVSVLLNNGKGIFLPAVSYTSSGQPLGLTAADFNGDGFPDLAVTELTGNQVGIMLNNGDGTFGSAVNYAVGLEPYSVAAADFTGDGNLDLAVANNIGASISTLRGDGTGRFSGPVTYDGGQTPFYVIAADLNGDGKPDMVDVDDNLYLIVFLNK